MVAFFEAFYKGFYGLRLQGEVAVVTRLVRCLDVQEHEVVVTECLDCCLCLALIVGVGESRRPFDINGLEPGITPDAAYQVYGGYHRAGFDLGV